MIRELRLLGLGLFACASLTMAPRTEAVASILPTPLVLNAFDTAGTVSTNFIPGGPRNVLTGQGTPATVGGFNVRIYTFPGSGVPNKTLEVEPGFLVITTDGTSSGVVKGAVRFFNEFMGMGPSGLVFGAGPNIDMAFRMQFPELFDMTPGPNVAFADEIPLPLPPTVTTPVNANLLGVLYIPGMGQPGSPIGDFEGTNIGFIFATAGTIIPAPAALAIFGMGLAGLGLTRRRKAGQAAIAA